MHFLYVVKIASFETWIKVKPIWLIMVCFEATINIRMYISKPQTWNAIIILTNDEPNCKIRIIRYKILKENSIDSSDVTKNNKRIN